MNKAKAKVSTEYEFYVDFVTEVTSSVSETNGSHGKMMDKKVLSNDRSVDFKLDFGVEVGILPYHVFDSLKLDVPVNKPYIVG